MSCEQYTNNINAEVEFSGTNLPANFCPDTLQALFNQFILSIRGNLPGTYSTFVISATEPLANDRDKLWLKVDAGTCRPVGFYLYYGGEWVRVDGTLFFGDDTSVTANAITVTALEPNINFISEDQLYAIRAANSNDGACTITLPITGITNIPITKYGDDALEGFEINAGMVLLLAYFANGGTPYFQLLNPRFEQVYPVHGLLNGSFELDRDEDGEPDKWIWAVQNSGMSSPPALEIVEAVGDQLAGGHAIKITPVGGQDVAYGTLTSQEFLECAEGEVLWLTWMLSRAPYDAGAAGPAPLYIKIAFYDYAQSSLGAATTVFQHLLQVSGSFPENTTWAKFGAVFRAPATAKFFKIIIQAGDNTTAAKSAKALWLDDFRLEKPQLDYNVDYIVAGEHYWVCPTGIYCALVSCVGAGGSGGYGNAGISSDWGGAGGGAGGLAYGFCNVVPGTNYLLSVGNGGDVTAGDGQNGTSTTFNTNWITGLFGEGGDQPANLMKNNGGPGGSGSSGGTNANSAVIDAGQTGQPGALNNDEADTPPFTYRFWGGCGGSSAFGAGGTAGKRTPDVVAENGAGYGSGGGGGAKNGSLPNAGTGADGLVKISW